MSNYPDAVMAKDFNDKSRDHRKIKIDIDTNFIISPMSAPSLILCAEAEVVIEESPQSETEFTTNIWALYVIGSDDVTIEVNSSALERDNKQLYKEIEQSLELFAKQKAATTNDKDWKYYATDYYPA